VLALSAALSSAVATTAAYTAATIGCFIAVPQIVRLVRTRETVGLSVGAWAVNTLSATAWLAYGLRTLQGAQVLANAFSLAGAVTVLWLLLVAGSQRRSHVARLAVGACVVAGSVLLLPMAWLTLPLAATGLISRIPQMCATASTWWNRRPSGVAVSTWGMAMTCAGLWLCSGALTGDAAIAWSSGIACTTAGLILAAETWPRPGGWASLEELDAEAAALERELVAA